MAETSRGATVRNVPGTRSEARRSERSVTLSVYAVYALSSLDTRSPLRLRSRIAVGAHHFMLFMLFMLFMQLARSTLDDP